MNDGDEEKTHTNKNKKTKTKDLIFQTVTLHTRYTCRHRFLCEQQQETTELNSELVHVGR